MVADVIQPAVNALTAPFWEAADSGRLVLPHSLATGQAFWPPSPISPFAEGGPVEWRPVAPAGTIQAMAVFRRIFHPAFAPLTPFAIALVELEAGPRIQVHVRHADDPGTPRPGDKVVIGFEAILPQGRRVPVAARHDPTMQPMKPLP